MKKEFGKWLMDVAKYMLTVILLSGILGDFGNTWLRVVTVFLIIISLAIGLFLLRDQKNKEKK